MKRFLALALIAVMLATGFALAEERPCMRQIEQNTYVLTLCITPESCPEIVLSPFYMTSIVSGFEEPWFVRFSTPENAIMLDFNMRDCSCVNEDAQIQYSYQALSNYSFEGLLNECANDDYTVADVSADPYVPGEGQPAGVNKADKEAVADAPAAEPTPAPAAASWVCASCNAKNDGNCCFNCGTKRP